MLGVIIPTHDRINDIINSLQIMKVNKTFKNIESQVVIVFDGNTISEKQKYLINEHNPCTYEPIIIENEKHIGQNKARNMAINKAKEKKYEYILFLDDDAVITDNDQLLKYKHIFNKYPDAGAVGITSIIQKNGQDQYYSNYEKLDGVFPIIYPCLAATIIKGDLAYSSDNFFFPNDIYYGSDEWALSIRVRSQNYQIYGTNLIKCIHRMSPGGRSKKQKYNLQYAHGFMWALLPRCLGLVMYFHRLIVNLFKSILNDKFQFDRVIGLHNGYKEGKAQKKNIYMKYNLECNNIKQIVDLTKKGYENWNGKIGKLIAKFMLIN